MTITVKVLVAQAVGTAPVPTPKVVIVRAAEKVKLHVMPPGVDLCQPPEFVVGTGNRVVEVQVEKWAAAQCKLKVLE